MWAADCKGSGLGKLNQEMGFDFASFRATRVGIGVNAGVSDASVIAYRDLIDVVSAPAESVTGREATELCDTLSPIMGDSVGRGEYNGVEGV